MKIKNYDYMPIGQRIRAARKNKRYTRGAPQQCGVPRVLFRTSPHKNAWGKKCRKFAAFPLHKMAKKESFEKNHPILKVFEDSKETFFKKFLWGSHGKKKAPRGFRALRSATRAARPRPRHLLKRRPKILMRCLCSCRKRFALNQRVKTRVFRVFNSRSLNVKIPCRRIIICAEASVKRVV